MMQFMLDITSKLMTSIMFCQVYICNSDTDRKHS